MFNARMGPYQSAGGQPHRPIEVHDQRADPMEGLISKLTRVMSEQFGLKPKEQGFMYRRSYPNWVEQAPMPPKYKLPEFSKFFEQDNITTIKHIGKYITQLGEAAASEALKIRLFSLSLSGLAFSWFASLPAGSIQSWADLEKRFHAYFYTGQVELTLYDLMSLK